MNINSLKHIYFSGRDFVYNSYKSTTRMIGLSLIRLIFRDQLRLNMNHFNLKKLKHFYTFSKLTSQNDLMISGSEQFTQSNLQELIEKIIKLKNPSKILMIDAREESHGFMNGHAISWKLEHNVANVGKSLKDILVEEKNLLKNLSSKFLIWTTSHSFPLLRRVKTVSSEEDLLKAYPKCTYIRVPITDHIHPSDQAVDQFVELVKGQKNDEWMHVHCVAGKGRTGTLMTMYDMLKNANLFTFDEIMDRSYKIGLDIAPNDFKPNFKKEKTTVQVPFPVASDTKEKSSDAKKLARWQFLKDFHRYCKFQKENGQNISWSMWINNEKNSVKRK